jgi:hypothetical protein
MPTALLGLISGMLHEQASVPCWALPDAACLHLTGNVSDAAKQLCEVTKHALDESIKVCGPGVPYSEIGKVIHAIADKHKYGIIRDFVGHGVGQLFHSAPTIVHYRNNYPGVMQVGSAQHDACKSSSVMIWQIRWLLGPPCTSAQRCASGQRCGLAHAHQHSRYGFAALWCLYRCSQAHATGCGGVSL